MKVLIGVDGSAGSAEAVRQAGQVLSSNDSIAFYYAQPELRTPAGSNIDPHVVSQAKDALARSVFGEAFLQLPAELRSRAEELPGTQDPRHGLLVAAEEWKADLIVVGARGLGAVKRWLVGSVSDSIALHAKVPVLVARARARASDNPLRVMMATDGSQACRDAADLVNRLSWPPGTSGQVMAVVESVFGGEVPAWLQSQARQSEWEPLARAWVREHDAEKSARSQELAGLCDCLSKPFQEQPPLVCEGHPAEQILKQLSNGEVDLIILGARRLGPVDRWLGSTSLKVLHHAPCSVLIVREHERP